MSTKNDAYLTVISHLETAAKLIRMAGIEVGQDPAQPKEERIQGRPDPDGLCKRMEEIFELLNTEVLSTRELLSASAIQVLDRRDAGQPMSRDAVAEMSPEELRENQL